MFLSCVCFELVVYLRVLSLYIIITIIIFECIRYKKYTIANCSTQHCTTHTVQTHHVSVLIYIRPHKSRLVGMATDDANPFFHIYSIALTTPHLYKLYPSQSSPFHYTDLATQNDKHCANGRKEDSNNLHDNLNVYICIPIIVKKNRLNLGLYIHQWLSGSVQSLWCPRLYSQFFDQQSVHSAVYGHFTVTLATNVPKSDLEMAVVQINDRHKVRSTSFDFNRRNWMPLVMLPERFVYVQHYSFYVFSLSYT